MCEHARDGVAAAVVVAEDLGEEAPDGGDRAEDAVAVLGRAGGRIKGGQHLRYPQDSRFSDLLVTLFDRAQIPVERIGDSAGLLSEV